MKKIALIGTSCSGKTTLLNYLQELHIKDQNIVFVPEAAREFFLNHKDIPEELRLTFSVQKQIQDIVIQKEQSAEVGVSTIVCDNSVLTPSAFVTGYGDKEGGDRLYKHIKDWLPTYTKLYLLDPVDIPYQTDDVRTESKATRNQVHEAFLTILADNNIGYELLGGTVSERAKVVKDFLVN